jgi:hypothetical protein
MNADAIDAADILLTELNEQEALLSQSAVTALSNGHLQEAKLIIGAIEQTQDLRNRAKRLKVDIAELHSSLVPVTQPLCHRLARNFLRGVGESRIVLILY